MNQLAHPHAHIYRKVGRPFLFSSLSFLSSSSRDTFATRFSFCSSHVNVAVNRLNDFPVPVGDSTYNESQYIQYS